MPTPQKFWLDDTLAVILAANLLMLTCANIKNKARVRKRLIWNGNANWIALTKGVVIHFSFSDTEMKKQKTEILIKCSLL